MASKTNVSILVGIIGILILLLTASIGYILAHDEHVTGKNSAENKIKVLKEIKELKTLYDKKIADKTNSYMMMQLQKDSIQKLVVDLENSKSNEASLMKYKTEFKSLESKMKVLVSEISFLRGKKNNVTEKKTNFKPENANNSSKPMVFKNNSNFKKSATNYKTETNTYTIENQAATPSKNVSETLVDASKKDVKLIVSNIKALAFSSKSSIKKVETQEATKTDFIKISFVVNENSNAQVGEKTFYFQVINSHNNVVGKRITEYFDNESLTYSFSKSINYTTQAVTVSQDFIDSNFEKGYYFINIFDRNQLVGKTSILLK